MSTWITDRLPCHADIDADGYVLVPTRSSDERTSIWQHAVEVKLGDPWLPAPPAYDPSPTREELVQELLDAIDGNDPHIKWKMKVLQARENLK